MAATILDGECETHGPTCNGTRPDCELADIATDDVLDTLAEVVEQARELRDRQKGE